MKFVVRRGTQPWKTFESEGYKNESHLQELVAEDPSLVPIEEMGLDAPPFSIAIREFPLDGSGYIDILAFNVLGDISVMECKLADNPEIRRKVLGQIVEYAAFLNRLNYDELDEIVRRKAGKSLQDMAQEMAQDPEWDAETFRQSVENNLSEGTFSLIIIVDQMDRILRTTVEYLNQRGLKNISLHVLEMGHFTDGDIEVLSPKVFGVVRREIASSNKRAPWSENDFLKQLGQRVGDEEVSASKFFLAFGKEAFDFTSWGRGATATATFKLRTPDDRDMSVFGLDSNGRITFCFGDMFSKLKDKSPIAELAADLKSVNGLQGIDAREGKYPGYRLADLAISEEGRNSLCNALRGFVKNVKVRDNAE